MLSLPLRSSRWLLLLNYTVIMSQYNLITRIMIPCLALHIIKYMYIYDHICYVMMWRNSYRNGWLSADTQSESLRSTKCHLLYLQTSSCSLLAWLNLRPCRWQRYVPPKPLDSSKPHGFVTQTTVSLCAYALLSNNIGKPDLYFHRFYPTEVIILMSFKCDFCERTAAERRGRTTFCRCRICCRPRGTNYYFSTLYSQKRALMPVGEFAGADSYLWHSCKEFEDSEKRFSHLWIILIIIFI
jgi:hypothetical protein